MLDYIKKILGKSKELPKREHFSIKIEDGKHYIVPTRVVNKSTDDSLGYLFRKILKDKKDVTIKYVETKNERVGK